MHTHQVTVLTQQPTFPLQCAALEAHMLKYTRHYVGVVPALLVGDVFFVGSECVVPSLR